MRGRIVSSGRRRRNTRGENKNDFNAWKIGGFQTGKGSAVRRMRFLPYPRKRAEVKRTANCSRTQPASMRGFALSAPSPRPSRGEGRGEGLSPRVPKMPWDLYPLTRIAPDDASHRRGNPTSPRKRRVVRGMIHCVAVHARQNRGKSVFSGCRDTEGRACDIAIAFLEGSLNQSIDGNFRRLWIVWMGMPMTSRSIAGIT